MSVQALLSEEQFLELPEYIGKQELLDGELIELPPAKHSHSELSRRIVALLEPVLDPSRIWIEAAYRLAPRRWLVPDVSVSWPDQRVEDDWNQGSPMIAIEIASRGNTAHELEKKRLLYLADGAAEVWFIYPKTHSMVVSRPDGALQIAPGADYHCALLNVTVTPGYRTPVR
ncbi:MAG: Uma2 family endonuclease [Bryobacteraceae bacterium]